MPDRPLGEWPPDSQNEGRLGNAGERVGSALGAVVCQTRELGGIVQDRMSDLKRKFRVIAGRRSTELKNRASELTDEAQQQASELANEARREARHWEFRARLYARERPFQFVAAAAAAGFVIGFLLRMWRDE
ncbi:MAG: glycine zipper domain-containing protein [Terriglobales bacterium]